MGEQFRDSTLLEKADRGNTECPYSGHDWEALEWSVPRELLELQRATRGQLDALRIWTTCLCCESLLTLDESYLANDDDDFPEETIVDKAYGWLEEQCFACDDLDLILMDVIEDARKFALSWEVRHEVNTEHSREADREKNAFRGALQANRNGGELCRTLLVKHETVSTLFGPPNDGLMRWQRVFIVGTALLIALTVDVWIYQQKGLKCCQSARQFLGCSADFAAPCRGFRGDCADLLDQFVDLPDVDVGSFECLEFPREDRYLDSVVVGAIMAAIVLPIKFVAEHCFEASNEADMPNAWLQWCDDEEAGLTHPPGSQAPRPLPRALTDRYPRSPPARPAGSASAASFSGGSTGDSRTPACGRGSGSALRARLGATRCRWSGMSSGTSSAACGARSPVRALSSISAPLA